MSYVSPLPSYPQIYEVMPYFVIGVVGLLTLWFLYSFFVVRNKPPTKEPVIGSYRVILKGRGLEFKGITTTANHIFNHAKIRKQLGDEADQMLNVLNRLYLYAIRDGVNRVLVVSDYNLESKEYTDSEAGNRYEAGIGWVSYRTVIGFGEVISKEIAPELFRFFSTDWDKIIIIYPDNIETGIQGFSSKTASSYDLAEVLALLQGAVDAKEQIQTRDEVIEVYKLNLDEALEKVVEHTDRGNLAEAKAATVSPFTPSDEREAEGFKLPFGLTIRRLLLIFGVAALGYNVIPAYFDVPQEVCFIIGAAAGFMATLIYDWWRKR